VGQSASITIDGSRADWSGLTAYPEDTTGESGIPSYDVDWQRVTMAHSGDQNTLYVRYQQNTAADFDAFPGFYNIYIDTDRDRGTGHIGIYGSELSLGADYLIQGSTIYAFSGALQTDFSWTSIGSVTADNSFSSLDIEYSLALSTIGSPTDFYFLLYGDNNINGQTIDYYPDSSNQGASGGVFEYNINQGAGGGSVP
jgi:hypothetical protein